MNRLVLSPIADSDLREIWEYIARKNPEAADQVLDTLQVSLERLLLAPSMGRPRPELADRLRSLTTGRYLIFYLFAKPEVQIVRVLHNARDIEEPEDLNLFPRAPLVEVEQALHG